MCEQQTQSLLSFNQEFSGPSIAHCQDLKGLCVILRSDVKWANRLNLIRLYLIDVKWWSLVVFFSWRWPKVVINFRNPQISHGKVAFRIMLTVNSRLSDITSEIVSSCFDVALEIVWLNLLITAVKRFEGEYKTNFSRFDRFTWAGSGTCTPFTQ